MLEDIELVKKERSFYKSWNTVFCFVLFFSLCYSCVIESRWEADERRLHDPAIENCQLALLQCNAVNETREETPCK